MNALERLANDYGFECTRVRQNLTIAESQLRDYQVRLGKPFLHEAYLSELTNLRDKLKTGLSGRAPEPGAEPQEDVAQIAERIKTLKGAHTFETTPERGGKRRALGEEPVTARIRRTKATPVSEESFEPRMAGFPTEKPQPDEFIPEAKLEVRSPLRTRLPSQPSYQERVLSQNDEKNARQPGGRGNL